MRCPRASTRAGHRSRNARGRAVPLVLASAVFTAIAAPALAHGEAEWIMANPTTRHCCGPQDCRPLADHEISQRDGAWYVNGYAVTPRLVYPATDGTGRFWACFQTPALVQPNCLFIPAMF
jgi:hypothetical protein